MQQSAATKGPEAAHFEVFQYPRDPQETAISGWECWSSPGNNSESLSETENREVAAGETALRAEFKQKLSEEVQRSFAAGRETGRQEGRQAERQAQAAALEAAAHERSRQAAELVESFARAQSRYMEAIEREVVELALAVAARILRREAQMDPLLLTGAVRVALGQLSRSTKVKLRVPASELEMWTEAIGLIPNLAVKPALEAGEGMRLGDCVIETEIGSVDLGVRSQLGEIERGFFDRAGRPRAEATTVDGEVAMEKS